MSRYTKKQFKIAVVFIVIVAIVIIGFWLLVKPPQTTCFDEVQNQGEEGIDCGGPCGPCEIPEDLIVLMEKFIPTTPSDFDLVARIKNPNPNWGVESLDYQFNIYDSNGELIGYKSGRTYLVPQETKYIIEQRMTTKMDPAKMDIELSNIAWQKLKDFKEIEIRIRDSGTRLTENNATQVFGNVENKSNYDLDRIEVVGVLLNGSRVIAAGRTEVKTVIVGEVRYLEITWPYEIADEITSFEIKPYTNIYLNENFLKTHGTQEKFKEY